jgi:hypothetical protein
MIHNTGFLFDPAERQHENWIAEVDVKVAIKNQQLMFSFLQ